MFVGILLRDPAHDFGVEFESLRHREIFKISVRTDKKLQGATLSHHTRFHTNFPKNASNSILKVAVL